MTRSDPTDQGTHLRILAPALIASAVLGLAFGAAPINGAQVAKEATSPATRAKLDTDQDWNNTNARPTKEEGVYRVCGVFDRVVKVVAGTRTEAYGSSFPRTLVGWDYDNKTGRLAVKERVDNGREIVIVFGERKVPWAWRMKEAITEVKVFLGKEPAVRGVDFEVDEAAGIVRFLKKEQCKRGVHYCIRYRYRDEPETGGRMTPGCIWAASLPIQASSCFMGSWPRGRSKWSWMTAASKRPRFRGGLPAGHRHDRRQGGQARGCEVLCRGR